MTKALFRQASNFCKRVIESAKNHYIKKAKESITFGILPTVFQFLFNGPEVLTSASEKAKLFEKLFSKNSKS